MLPEDVETVSGTCPCCVLYFISLSSSIGSISILTGQGVVQTCSCGGLVHVAPGQHLSVHVQVTGPVHILTGSAFSGVDLVQHGGWGMCCNNVNISMNLLPCIILYFAPSYHLTFSVGDSLTPFRTILQGLLPFFYFGQDSTLLYILEILDIIYILEI